MRPGANPPLVGDYNRRVVLEGIRRGGPVSRVELVGLTGLKAAAISTIVRQLIDEGLVAEAGQGVSTGGKPRTLLCLNPGGRYAVGVQLGAETSTIVITDFRGVSVARSNRPGAGTDAPGVVIARIAHEIESLLTRGRVDRSLVTGVGVATPGPLDHTSGTLLSPPSLQGWESVRLAELLRERLGLPVLVDNDANAAAIAETWTGRAPESRSMACVFMETGLGAGLVLGGDLYRGTHSGAGEFGHTCVEARGPDCYCGNRGCLELLAAPRAVVEAAGSDRESSAPDSAGHRTVPARFAAIAGAAMRGNRRAAGLIEESAALIAVGVLNLTNILDLDLVVLSGRSFAIAGPVYQSVIERELGRALSTRSAGPVTVRVSDLVDSAAAVGAAALVLHSAFLPRLGAGQESRPLPAGPPPRR